MSCFDAGLAPASSFPDVKRCLPPGSETSPMSNVIDRLRGWARALKQDTLLVYFAARDPRTPPGVRLLALGVAAYALSPIDLIPDFIPVLGYLDDVVIVPLGIALVVRWLPEAVKFDARQRATAAASRPTSRGAAVAFVAIWLLAIVLIGLRARALWQGRHA